MIAGSDYLRSIVSSPWTCTTVSPKHSAKKAMKRRRLGIPEPPMFRGMCHNQRTGRGGLKKGMSGADCNFVAACPLGHTTTTPPNTMGTSQPSLACECPIQLGGHVSDVLLRARARGLEQKLRRALPRWLQPPTLWQGVDKVAGIGERP
jgi:hypothetical protein